MSYSTPKAVLAIDIGGTKIAASLYAVENGQITDQRIGDEIRIEPPAKGLEGHPAQIAQLVKQVKLQAEQQGYELVAVGVGSPGKFIDDPNDRLEKIIDKGTNPNLGNHPEEFNDANLRQLFRNALDKQHLQEIPIFVMNDAVAAHMSLLHQTLDGDDQSEKNLILGKTVGYIGPGTGAGGSFARVDAKGSITPITDGHICDMLVDLNDPALKLDEIGYSADRLKAISAALPEGKGLEFEGDSIRVESVVSGTGMARILGLSSAKEIDLGNTDHVNGLKLMGRVVAAMIRDIRKEEVHKLERVRQWTEEEQTLAARTSTYYFSGGLGKGEEGRLIVEEAQKTLGEMGISDVSFIRRDSKNAVRAAADAVPAELLAERKGRVNDY